MMAAGLDAHLNTAFKHYVIFCEAFGLVDVKEWEPLREIYERFTSG